jgi:hypothetical protein
MHVGEDKVHVVDIETDDVVRWVIYCVFGVLAIALVGYLGWAIATLPTSGKVVSMEYVPAHQEISHTLDCQTIGKAEICTSVPYTVHYDDTWKLQICNQKDRCRWIEVTQIVYQRMQLGLWYDPKEIH